MHHDYMASTMVLGLAKIIPMILFAAAGWFVFIKLPFFVFLKVLKDSKAQDFESAMQRLKVELDPDMYKPNYNVKNHEAFLRRSRRGKDEEVKAKKEFEEILNQESETSNETPEQKKERHIQNERRKKYAEELKTKADEQMRLRQEQRAKQKDAERAERERLAREEKEKSAREARDKAQQEEKQWQEYFHRSKSRRDQTPQTGSAEAIFNIKTGEELTQEELKKRYRELLKVNHPDKVATEGTQVRQLADKRTKEINSAYEKLKLKVA